MSEEKIVCWRGTDGDVQPVKCICEDKFGYPNYCKDETGKDQKMYQNTHFLEKEDAWKAIVRSVKAGVSLSGALVKRVMDELEKAQAEAANSVLEYHNVKANKDNPFSDEM